MLSIAVCVAACCIVLQYVAVCGSILQRGAVCCNMLQCVAECCRVLQRWVWAVSEDICVRTMTLYYTFLQCVAVCCSVLQCVQCVAVWSGDFGVHTMTVYSTLFFSKKKLAKKFSADVQVVHKEFEDGWCSVQLLANAGRR